MKNSLLIFSLAAALVAVTACNTAKSTAAAPTPTVESKLLVATPQPVPTREDTINNAAMKTRSKLKGNLQAAPMHVEKQMLTPASEPVKN